MKKLSKEEAIDVITQSMQNQYEDMSRETLVEIIMGLAKQDLNKMNLKDVGALLSTISAGQLSVDNGITLRRLSNTFKEFEQDFKKKK